MEVQENLRAWNKFTAQYLNEQNKSAQWSRGIYWKMFPCQVRNTAAAHASRWVSSGTGLCQSPLHKADSLIKSKCGDCERARKVSLKQTTTSELRRFAWSRLQASNSTGFRSFTMNLPALGRRAWRDDFKGLGSHKWPDDESRSPNGTLVSISHAC